MQAFGRRAVADRRYLALLACHLLIQALTSALDWYGFSYRGWRKATPTRAALVPASPWLSASVRLLSAIFLLLLALLPLRAILPGRWLYLALWRSLAISLAALCWDAHFLL